MEWSENALVLGMGSFREADIWLRLLTPEHGLIIASAFGGARSRKRFCGCLDLYNELNVRIKAKGNFLTVQEAVLVRGPRRLRTDHNRLGIFVNCVQFTRALGVPEENAAEIFSTLRDLLLVLEEAENVQNILPVLFRMRLASAIGYAPTFSVCAVCGRKEMLQATFFPADGILICPFCVAEKIRGKSIALSEKSLELLRQVQTQSPLTWEQNTLSFQERQECGRAIDDFVQYHLGFVWENGRFCRNM